MLITFAAEEASKTPYYVAGLALAAFAVIISAIGISRHATFPSSPGAARTRSRRAHGGGESREDRSLDHSWCSFLRNSVATDRRSAR